MISEVKTLPITDKKSAFETLDALREGFESGDLIGLAVVTLSKDDSAKFWTAAVQNLSMLKLVGMISALHHWALSPGCGSEDD